MTIKEYMSLSVFGRRCVSYQGHLWVPEWSVGMKRIELFRCVKVNGNYRTTRHTRCIRRDVPLDVEVTPATEKRHQMIY